jgi:hypothetical protein
MLVWQRTATQPVRHKAGLAYRAHWNHGTIQHLLTEQPVSGVVEQHSDIHHRCIYRR